MKTRETKMSAGNIPEKRCASPRGSLRGDATRGRNGRRKAVLDLVVNLSDRWTSPRIQPAAAPPLGNRFFMRRFIQRPERLNQLKPVCAAVVCHAAPPLLLYALPPTVEGCSERISSPPALSCPPHGPSVPPLLRLTPLNAVPRFNGSTLVAISARRRNSANPINVNGALCSPRRFARSRVRSFSRLACALA
jgi:hypothetical protein